MFKRNEWTLDRIVRLVLAAVLLPAGLFWLGGLQDNVLGLLLAVDPTHFALMPQAGAEP